ncbi:hypothetical protein B0H19DRAFT_60090 [Mycena capillaripes]|nr:hypothetical protein B0H19DRAFT_60090 [Mycena capillaripes]
MFLIEYATELKLHEAQYYLGDSSLDTQFTTVFDLVRAHHYTLFVAVDNYDAPTRARFSAHLVFPAIHGTFASIQDIENLLDSCFWSPLLAGSHAITKLLITGSLLIKYSALENLDLSAVPSLQSSCGFTEEQVLQLGSLALGATPAFVDLRCSYGSYVFSSAKAGGRMAEPVLHPQLVINRIRELSLPHPPVDESDSFRLLSSLLNLIPEESDVPGSVTIDNLIELLATGAVEVGGKLDSPFAFEAMTWSTLYYAGAFTCDRNSADTLRVASSAVLRLIHSRVDTVFADRHRLEWEFLNTWYKYNIHHDPQPFLDLTTEVLRDQTRRLFGQRREVDLRGIVELIMRNTCSLSNSRIRPLILFPDVARVEIPAFKSDKWHMWELQTLTLRGMWQATNMNDGEPTVEALETLHKELVSLEEEDLLARPYRAWSPTLNAMETVLVGGFLDPEPESTQFLAVGGAHILMRGPLSQQHGTLPFTPKGSNGPENGRVWRGANGDTVAFLGPSGPHSHFPTYCIVPPITTTYW